MVANLRLRLFSVTENALSYLLFYKQGEPQLYRIDPLSDGRCEMQMKARPFQQAGDESRATYGCLDYPG
jgi:hypothetical protein